jgi:hypothetical protein
VARHPGKYNKVCAVKAGHVSQNLSDDQMVRRVTTETLQCTQGVCAEEMALPRLTPDEHESSSAKCWWYVEANVTSIECGESEITGRAYDIPGWSSWESDGNNMGQLYAKSL